MSKTKRKSKLYRERQTVIQLEKLEARQLLATVTGGGEEVGSDISYQGNVYDQVLMQGAAVSVEADPGQIVRVSWIDGNGDITQGEFSGSGTFTVSLDDFVEPAEPENYNQPGVEYASGHASITIEGTNSSSNVSVFTVGPTTSHNFGALDTGVDLDGVADIARITIVADPSQPGGSTFGGIRTANAMYSDDSGVVGITADGVQVQSVVIIGDIDARNSGIPTLLFGESSQFGTVEVAGGDLAQTNGELIKNDGFQTVSFIDGTTSDGVLQPAGVFAGDFQKGEPRITTLATATEINIEGMSQAELDAIFFGKTFSGDVTIVGNLEAFKEINVVEFQKNVTFDGVYAGAINAKAVGGDITFMGIATEPETEGVERTVSSDISVGSLGGSLIFGSETDTGDVNYSGILMTSSMASGALQVFGDFTGTGTVTTDADADGSFDIGEGALGDIHVSGDFSGNAVGILGIGDITVGGKLTSEGTAFYTSSDDAPEGNSIAAIGTLTVMGDVDQDDGDYLIEIANNGSFGAITLMGGGTDVGRISIVGSLLGGSNGDISITGSYTVDVHGIDVNAGSLGHITITGIAGTGVAGENEVSTLTLGNVVAEDSSIGNVSISGSDKLTLNAITTKTAGMLDFSANKSIDVDEAIKASFQLGAITFTGSTDINADITSAWMGPVMFDGNVTFKDGMGLVSGDRDDAGDKAAASTGRLTSFEVTGNTTFNSAKGANIVLATGGDFTFGGMVTGTASSTEIVASSLGDFSFSAALGINQALVENLTVRATPGDGDRVAKDGSKATDGTNLSDYSIGNISVESTNTIGIPGASLFAGNNVFHALGAIGDISLLGGGSPNAQTPLFSTVMEDSLLLIVGDTTGDPTKAPRIDFDGDRTTTEAYADLKESTVSIGNVSINVGTDSSNYNSFAGAGDPDATAPYRFTGMNILSGVHAASDEQINAVHDRFEDVSNLEVVYNTANTNLTNAQNALDDILGDLDAADLVQDISDAEDALGTDEDTAEMDTAYGGLAAAQKALDDGNTALTEGSAEYAAVAAAKLALGTVEDEAGTSATDGSAFARLAFAQTALNAAKGIEAYDNRIERVADEKKELGEARKLITDIEAEMVIIKTKITAAAEALRAAKLADIDNDIDAAEYTAAFIADRMFAFDRSDIDVTVTDNTNLGREAYIENAVRVAISIEAEKAWNALTDGLGGEKLTQGYESFNTNDNRSDIGSEAAWAALGIIDPDRQLDEGKEAWVAQFISTTASGADNEMTMADTAGNTALVTVTGTAAGAYTALDDDDEKLEAGRTAVGIKAARDAAAQIANEADNVPTFATILMDLEDEHVAGYREDLGDETPTADDDESAYARLIAAKAALGKPLDTVDTPGESAYTQLAIAEAALIDTDNSDVVDVNTAQTAVETATTALANAQRTHAEALAAATGTITVEDVAKLVTARNEAQTAVDTAQKALDDANKALPFEYAAAKTTLDEAQKAYDTAQMALEAIGAQTLDSDEILVRNDADLKGTIGKVNIQNMTTLLTTNAVADITDDLSITIGSASGIVGATGVGSLDESKAGMIIGGDDSSLDEDELLVYIV